jgi:hypothetical protein
MPYAPGEPEFFVMDMHRRHRLEAAAQARLIAASKFADDRPSTARRLRLGQLWCAIAWVVPFRRRVLPNEIGQPHAATRNAAPSTRLA